MVGLGSRDEAPLNLLNFRLTPASGPSGNVSDVPFGDLSQGFHLHHTTYCPGHLKPPIQATTWTERVDILAELTAAIDWPTCISSVVQARLAQSNPATSQPVQVNKDRPRRRHQRQGAPS